MATEQWISEAFERALVVAPGKVVEPFAAYSEHAVVNGLTVLRSEEVTGDVLVRGGEGERNVLFCGYKSRFAGKSGLRVNIIGSDNVIFVGAHAAVGGTEIDIYGNGNVFYIGAFSSIGNMIVDLHQALRTNLRGSGGCMVIGDHCMLATRVVASNADGHAIYDRSTGKRVNLDADILIGDHVWIGRDVRINKGAQIGRDVIVGQGAVVSGHLQEGCAYAGVPARLIRENVTWSRMNCESIEEMESSSRHKQFLRQVDRLNLRIAKMMSIASRTVAGAALYYLDWIDLLPIAEAVA